MIVKIDFYKKGGKWYTGGFVELEPMPWQSGVKQAIVNNQEEMNDSWIGDYFVVLSDHPESRHDPNYRMTYNRHYHYDDFSGMTKTLEEEV